MIYKTHVHRRIFKLALRERNVNSAYIQAAIFLLTSNRSLWNRVKLCVTAESVLFDEFPKINYTPEEQIIIDCSKDVIFRTRNVSITDLVNTTSISFELFCVICNAIAISRQGLQESNQAHSQV